MKTSTKLITLASTALALAAGAQIAHGAGFAIYETSSRGFAMGNANVGRSNDASALYSNPAAITRLDGTQVTAGVSFIAPTIDITTYAPGTGAATDTSMNDYVQPVPHLYATRRITDDLAVGLAVFVPYGLKSDFDPGWVGRYNNYLTDITTIDITPTVAYRIIKDKPWAKSVSIALGAQILYADVDMRRVLPAALPNIGDKQLILQGDTWEYGYSAAVQWEINDMIALGLVYRSGFKLNFDSATEEIVGVVPKHGGAWGKINLPDSLALGLNYSPIPNLDIGLQFLRTGWSSYDKLDIYVPALKPYTPTQGLVSKPKKWSDVWRYSLGAEYQTSEKIALRVGFVVDKDPVNREYADYMVPSNDRLIYSAGLGWKINELITMDFAYGYLVIKSAHLAANQGEGVYDTDIHTGHAHIASVSANLRF